MNIEDIVVDVRNSTVDVKKLIQKAFFKLGIYWSNGRGSDLDTEAIDYISCYYVNKMYGNTYLECGFYDVSDGYITPKEFLNSVYIHLNEHKHADLMLLYAKDAKETSEPWKLWQYRNINTINQDWLDMKQNPDWNIFCEYRKKPKTHIVNGVEIPDLRVDKLTENKKFYVVNILSKKYYTIIECIEDSKKRLNMWLNRGLVYENSVDGKNACIMHSKALIGE